MGYKIIEKKKFVNKLIKLLEYLDTNWNNKVATNFYQLLIWHINLLQQQLLLINLQFKTTQKHFNNKTQ
jgi:hypothetical protein